MKRSMKLNHLNIGISQHFPNIRIICCAKLNTMNFAENFAVDKEICGHKFHGELQNLGIFLRIAL